MKLVKMFIPVIVFALIFTANSSDKLTKHFESFLAKNLLDGKHSKDKYIHLLPYGRPLLQREYSMTTQSDHSYEVLYRQFKLVDSLPNLIKRQEVFEKRIKLMADEKVSGNEDDVNSIASYYTYILKRIHATIKIVGKNKTDSCKQYLQEMVSDPQNSRIKLTRLDVFRKYKIGSETNQESSQTRKTEKWLNELPGFENWLKDSGKMLDSLVNTAYKSWKGKEEKEAIEECLHHQKLFGDFEYKVTLALGYLQRHQLDLYKGSDQLFYKVGFHPPQWTDYLKAKSSESQYQLQHRLKKTENDFQKLVEENKFRPHRRLRKRLSEQREAEVAENARKIKALAQATEKLRLSCSAANSKSETSCSTYKRSLDMLEKAKKDYTRSFWQKEVAKDQKKMLGDIASEDSQINRHILEIKMELDDLRELVNSPTSKVINVGQLPQADDTVMMYYKFSLRKGEGEWVFHKTYASVHDDDLLKYNQLANFLNQQVKDVTVSATLIKVDIINAWLNASIFATPYSYSMLDPELQVSPGPQPTPSQFREVVSSGQYLLPAFPASLLLATDIEISIPSYSLPHDMADNLLALSYDPLVSGRYGPFSFGRMYGDSTKVRKAIKFQIDQSSRQLILRLPGAELMGYLCQVVAKFPSMSKKEKKRKPHSHVEF